MPEVSFFNTLWSKKPMMGIIGMFILKTFLIFFVALVLTINNLQEAACAHPGHKYSTKSGKG